MRATAAWHALGGRIDLELPWWPQALAFMYDKALVANMFKAAPERYKDRAGGYCRVTTRLIVRRGDAAEMAEIELV
jgi:large subunit ribosomal protein L17